MRTYTFYYCDSYKDCCKLDYKDFVVSASTYSIAFSRFSSFLKNLDCKYICYAPFYAVVTLKNTKSFRSFKESDLVYLANLKDEHNASFYEDLSDEL